MIFLQTVMLHLVRYKLAPRLNLGSELENSSVHCHDTVQASGVSALQPLADSLFHMPVTSYLQRRLASGLRRDEVGLDLVSIQG